MKWNNESYLEVVEQLAAYEGKISCEEDLSTWFDEDYVRYVIDEYSADDQVAINEAFNNWTDELCKEGEIHPEQYNNYCYVGYYS